MAGVGGSAAKGALGGAGSGLALGSNPLLMGATGGLSAPIGAAVGAVAGGVSSGIKANKAKKADEGIQAQDPREIARLAEINRIRKSIGAGTDPLAQQQINQAKQTGASTQGNIARVTGGNVGATVAGLTRAQRGTQAATNQALAQSQQRLPFFENMAQQLNTRISQRSLEVGLMKRDQAMAEKAADQKAASANIAGAIGALGGIPKVGAGLGAGLGPSQPPLAVKQDVGFDQQSNGFISEGAPGVDKSVFNIDDDNDDIVIENVNQQSQQAPALSQDSAMTRIGKQFDTSTVLGPDGLNPVTPSQPTPNIPNSIINSQQSINAISGAYNNIDNLNNLPLKPNTLPVDNPAPTLNIPGVNPPVTKATGGLTENQTPIIPGKGPVEMSIKPSDEVYFQRELDGLTGGPDKWSAKDQVDFDSNADTGTYLYKKNSGNPDRYNTPSWKTPFDDALSVPNNFSTARTDQEAQEAYDQREVPSPVVQPNPAGGLPTPEAAPSLKYSNSSVDNNGDLTFNYNGKEVKGSDFVNGPIENKNDGQDYLRNIHNEEAAFGSFSGSGVDNYGYTGTGPKGGALLEYFNKAEGTKSQKALATTNKYIIGEDNQGKLNGGNKTVLQDLNISRDKFDTLPDDVKEEIVNWKLNSGRGTTDLIMIAAGKDWDGLRAFEKSSPTSEDVSSIDLAKLSKSNLRNGRMSLYEGRIEGLKKIIKEKGKGAKSNSGELYTSILSSAEKGYNNSQKYR